jgi:hypothetical protein
VTFHQKAKCSVNLHVSFFGFDFLNVSKRLGLMTVSNGIFAKMAFRVREEGN